jgi:hypothetical protein
MQSDLSTLSHEDELLMLQTMLPWATVDVPAARTVPYLFATVDKVRMNSIESIAGPVTIPNLYLFKYPYFRGFWGLRTRNNHQILELRYPPKRPVVQINCGGRVCSLVYSHHFATLVLFTKWLQDPLLSLLGP